MPINTPNQGHLAKQENDNFRTKIKQFEIAMASLKPNTVYEFFINGINYGFASRTIGKRLGDPLVSDDRGQMKIYYSMEVIYDQPTYSYQFAAGENNPSYNNGSLRPSNLIISNQFIELKAPGSYFATNIEMPVLVVQEDTVRIEGHSH